MQKGYHVQFISNTINFRVNVLNNLICSIDPMYIKPHVLRKSTVDKVNSSIASFVWVDSHLQ